MSPEDRKAELAWRKRMIPKLQREYAAGQQADKRARRKAAAK